MYEYFPMHDKVYIQLFLSIGSAIIKHMDIQFESMRQENVKEFKHLSKKLNHKHNIDLVNT